MSSKHFCDRLICGKEITGVKYRLRLPLNKEMDLCEDCSKEFESWIYQEPMKDEETQ